VIPREPKGVIGMGKAARVPLMSGPQGERFLTIQQLAERLTVSVGCIRAWRIRGEGPPAIRVGTALRWDAAEVNAWIDARRESRLEA